MFYYIVKYLILWLPLHLLFRPWVQGSRNVPKKGAAIFASNHVSFSDSIFLPLIVKRRITFLAKIDYWRGTGIRGFLIKSFFSGVGQVPVDRSGGSAAEAALTMAINILKNGNFLGIYPEGTRAPDGRLYRGRTGVARMALEAQVPVIPVAMIGTYQIQPPGQFFPKIGRVGVRFGKPLDFSQYYQDSRNVEVLRKVTNEIMQSIHKLSNQEYVDIYATNAKEILKKDKKDRDEISSAEGEGQ